MASNNYNRIISSTSTESRRWYIFFFIIMECSNVLLTSNKVDALNTQFTQIYQQQDFAPYTVNGQVTGQFKNAGTFSYVRIYGAGHEVPAYKVCSCLDCSSASGG